MPGKRTYTCDEAFFQIIDTEPKAYWLGFIAADGYISEHRRVELTLANKDRCHLEALKLALKSTQPIADKLASCKGKTYPSARCVINSVPLIRSLEEHGVHTRKSLTFAGPIGVPDVLSRHFIRGYADGNGGFSSSKGRFQFYFTSTLTFIRQVEQYFSAYCGVEPLRLLDHHNGVTHSIFHTGPKALRIGGFLYDNCEVFLPRKKEKLENAQRALGS